MKPKLYVHIPQPCHEDWTKMTPVDKGKFCGSCSKQVVDFSNMTDHEVLSYFSKSTGKVCGRFAVDQLQRPLQPLAIEKKKAWWIAMLMPLLLLFGKVNAQKKNPRMTGTSVITKNPQPEIMGKVMLPKITPVVDTAPAITKREILVGDVAVMKRSGNFIKGQIINTEGKPVEWATIENITDNISGAADSAGNFSIIERTLSDSISIRVSAIGYEVKEIKVNSEDAQSIIITLQQKEAPLSDIIINSYSNRYLKGTAGGISICRHVTKIQIINTAIRKTFHSAAFKIYPNPVQRGTKMTVDVKQPGDYSIQIFDNTSKLLQVQDFTASKSATSTSVIIPSGFSAGIYYIRLVDNKTKKQYTDKFIIQ